MRIGVAVVELLVVLAVLTTAGVLFLWIADGRSRDLSTSSRLAASGLVQERHQALIRGVESCVERRAIASRLLDASSIASWPPRGLLFTPDGLPRTCDGGGVGNTTILLEHRGRQAAVIVSALGRVRWELR